MKYTKAPDIEEKTAEVIRRLGMNHVQKENLAIIRSFGSSSRAIARCHGLGKVMQLGLGRKAFYVLEFISERFDRMSEEDKIKTIIHELMHIPLCFGGGFKHHDYVTNRNVDKLYRQYLGLGEKQGFVKNIGFSLWH